MKTNRLISILAFVAPLVAATPALAESHGLGLWRGTGTTFGRDGRALGDFTVELTREKGADEQTVVTRGQAILGDGRHLPIEQKMVLDGNHFTLETNRGKGGGICLGEGLCISHEEGSDGKSFATTIVFDGPDQLRLLITELDHGQAVRFLRQTLTRSH